MKKLLKNMSLLSAVFVLAACGSSGESDGSNDAAGQDAEQIANYTAPAELDTLDTTLITDANSANYTAHLVEGLLKVDENGEPAPAIAAEEGEISEDGLTYTYKLREDAQWANGDDVTAHDFVYALQKLVDPETGAAYSYLTENIENASEIIQGDKDPSELGVTADGDYEITYELTQPTPYFEYLLAFTSFAPQNEEFVEEMGDSYGTSSDTILENGPYIMENWDGTGLTWDLEKNDDYYAADEVNLDEINVQVVKETTTAVNLFEGGEIDNAQLTGEMVKQYEGDEDAVVQNKARTAYLEFNWDNEELQNEKLREALGLVINTEDLVETVLGDGSTTLDGFLPKDFVFSPEDETDFADEAGSILEHDVDQAKELWEEAKEELDVDSVTFSLVADDDEKNKKISEYIQGQIENNLDGVNIELRNVPKKNRLALSEDREFDLVQTGWGADFADPINFMDLLVSGSSYNRGGYENEDYDKYIEAAKTTDANDEEARWDDLIDAHGVLVDDVAFIPLYQEAETQLRNPALKGIVFQPVGIEFDLSRAYLEN